MIKRFPGGLLLPGDRGEKQKAGGLWTDVEGSNTRLRC